MRGGPGEVALAGVEGDRRMVDEVVDRDGVGDVVGEGSVAAVGDRPFGPEDGGGAVACPWCGTCRWALAWSSWRVLIEAAVADGSAGLVRLVQRE